jgi:hypothetical protein
MSIGRLSLITQGRYSCRKSFAIALIAQIQFNPSSTFSSKPIDAAHHGDSDYRFD